MTDLFRDEVVTAVVRHMNTEHAEDSPPRGEHV
jgi:predicted small metal-binding protein